MAKKYAFITVFYLLLLSINCSSQIHLDDSTKNFIELDKGYKMLYKDTLGKKAIIVFKAPEFKGGIAAYTKFLERNIDADLGAKYIRLRRKDSSAQQTVEIEFTVTKAGTVADVKPLNARYCHPKLVAEALRVIESSGRWIPAELELFFDSQSNSALEQAKNKIGAGKGLTKVPYNHKQNVTFYVTHN